MSRQTKKQEALAAEQTQGAGTALGCLCIAVVNAKLREHNGILVFNLLANPSRAMVSITKRDARSRQKPPLMEATFCPFCGDRYPDTKRELASALANAEAAKS